MRLGAPIRALLVIIALAFAGAGVAFVVAQPAIAQSKVERPKKAIGEKREKKPWSLRDMLFFSRKSSRVEAPEIENKQRVKVKKRKSAPRKPAEPAVVILDKLPDAKVILVVGDFVGAGIAEGLNAVYAANPRVKIVDRTSASSGFVRNDKLDWVEKIAPMMEEEKASVVVFLAGANDRQQMRVDGNREAVRSDKWITEYTTRAENFAKAVTNMRKPLVWVGVPPFKSPKANSDMLALNEIYRAAATDAKGEFIDVWDGFVDEAGAFMTNGPDINGQSVRLRSSDGFNFSQAGKRKLAFYTEKSLKKILGEGGDAAVAALPSPVLAAPGEKVDPASIVRTTPVSLFDPALDSGGELLGAKVTLKEKAGSPGEKLTVEGIAAETVPDGRADQFAWPPQPAAPATALAPVEVETTTNAIKN